VRKGNVSFFNDSKGFGFIKDLETQESVFVHVNNTLEEIKENNIVSFEIEMGPKGPTAVKVKLFKS
ncbi:cold-shock protein, partial [Bacteroidota bacterium]